MMKRAVIFDMDGLMLDSERIAFSAWKRACLEAGHPISDETILAMVGRTTSDSEQILREAMGPDFPLQEVKERRIRYTDMEIHEQGMPVKPGLCELLDLLDRAGVSKGVATSTTRARAMMKLGKAGIANRFPVIVAGNEVQRGKPAPDIYLLTAERLSVPPHDCVVLEDSDPGVFAAHAAGMQVIIVPDLKQPSEEAKALAYAVSPSLHEVRHYLPTVLRGQLPHGTVAMKGKGR